MRMDPEAAELVGAELKPRFLRSVAIGTELTLAMLFVNWQLVPLTVRFVSGSAPEAPWTPFLLTLDLTLSFAVALTLMCVAIRDRRLYGATIALAMAVVGWAAYFVEVGFFRGMVRSEYPQWYEWLSFFRMPAACLVAWYSVRGRPRPETTTPQLPSVPAPMLAARAAKVAALFVCLLVASAAGVALWT